MKFGLRYASLGRYASGPAAVELAQAAEAAGFDSIWTVEHVVVPHGYQSRYPYSETGRMGSGLEDFPIPDPLIWLAYIASATRTLKLGTPHHPTSSGLLRATGACWPGSSVRERDPPGSRSPPAAALASEDPSGRSRVLRHRGCQRR